MATRADDRTTDEPAPGSKTADGSTDERTPHTALNGIIGGVVGVVLFFIPFSTVLGGGVAGYLDGGDLVAGAKVGAIAGLVALLPFLLVVGVIGVVGPLAMIGHSGVPAALWLVLFFVLMLATVYVVGLSIVGGMIGAYLKREL